MGAVDFLPIDGVVGPFTGGAFCFVDGGGGVVRG